jgi:uncharacterized protein YdiU (UPF0061 family)
MTVKYVRKEHMISVFSWRIHWLYTSLMRLVDKTTSQTDASQEKLTAFVDEFVDIVHNRFDQLVWEAVTMTALSEKEVREELKTLESYQRYIEIAKAMQEEAKKWQDKLEKVRRDFLEEKLKVVNLQ